MKIRSDIENIVATFIEDLSISENITTYLNLAVEQAEKMVNWPALFKYKDLTVTDGVLVPPPRYRVITKVTPVPTSGASAAYEFHPELNNPTGDQARIYRAMMLPYMANESASASGLVSVTQGSATVSAVSGGSLPFSASDVGKELSLAGDSAVYEVTAFDSEADTLTVYPVVSHETSESVSAQTNHAGREQFLLVDKDLAPYTGTVRVYYQVWHPALYDDESLLLIPCPHTVAYKAIQLCLQQNKYDVDASRLEPLLVEVKNEEIGNTPFKKSSELFQDALFRRRR
jgi:hypothetical protein